MNYFRNNGDCLQTLDKKSDKKIEKAELPVDGRIG